MNISELLQKTIQKKILNKLFQFVIVAQLVFVGLNYDVGLVNAGDCIPGKKVGRDFFIQVSKKLSNPGVSNLEFAVDALQAWEPHENTRACWNPLATTWRIPGSTNFNNAGVKNYQNKATGVRATVNTLNLNYYNAIRNLLALRSFNREGLRSALGTWGTCKGSNCDAILNKWQKLWKQYKGVEGSGSGGNSDSWEFCAHEGQRCYFAFEGRKDVAYGANGKYHYKNRVNSSIMCNNETFDDPIYGVSKACFTRPSKNSSGGGSGSESASAGSSSCKQSGKGVYLYEHANYEGRCSKFIVNSSNPRSWRIGNDSASSIRIVGNWLVVLYEHDEYKGDSSAFIINDPYLGNDTIGNDRVSSIKVYGPSSQ